MRFIKQYVQARRKIIFHLKVICNGENLRLTTKLLAKGKQLN